ncbi:MAG: helix-turn-helix domain-containing protein [Lachnospiraceae bacterium]|nr:helix-turn-helix domain-containing protein [Ruminococcus sp.]MCM1276777.1 helix-turn-helix domain-containing protein [Lachnospiraceae bacterium]
MNNIKLFYTAAEIAELLGVSVGQAYKIIRAWNAELAKENYLVIAGKIPVEYFNEKMYKGVANG